MRFVRIDSSHICGQTPRTREAAEDAAVAELVAMSPLATVRPQRTSSIMVFHWSLSARENRDSREWTYCTHSEWKMLTQRTCALCPQPTAAQSPAVAATPTPKPAVVAECRGYDGRYEGAPEEVMAAWIHDVTGATVGGECPSSCRSLMRLAARVHFIDPPVPIMSGSKLF